MERLLVRPWILRYLQWDDVINVITMTRAAMQYFMSTFQTGTIPLIEKLHVSQRLSNELLNNNAEHSNPLLRFLLEHAVRNIVCESLPYSAGCQVLKILMTRAPNVTSLQLLRPLSSSIKRLSLLPVDHLAHLSLGRPGYSNQLVNDNAFEQIMSALGQQLKSLQLVKLNSLTVDSLRSIGDQCDAGCLESLSVLSCKKICETSSLAPQGFHHLLTVVGPNLVHLDLRYSIEMCDHWLQCLITLTTGGRGGGGGGGEKREVCLRTFTSSRTMPITAGAVLTQPMWTAFCHHFKSSATLLYIDCMAQEGREHPPRATFLYESDLHRDHHERIDELCTSLSNVVVHPLDEDIFAKSPHRPRSSTFPRMVTDTGVDAMNCVPVAMDCSLGEAVQGAVKGAVEGASKGFAQWPACFVPVLCTAMDEAIDAMGSDGDGDGDDAVEKQHEEQDDDEEKGFEDIDTQAEMMQDGDLVEYCAFLPPCM